MGRDEGKGLHLHPSVNLIPRFVGLPSSDWVLVWPFNRYLFKASFTSLSLIWCCVFLRGMMKLLNLLMCVMKHVFSVGFVPKRQKQPMRFSFVRNPISPPRRQFFCLFSVSHINSWRPFLSSLIYFYFCAHICRFIFATHTSPLFETVA